MAQVVQTPAAGQTGGHANLPLPLVTWKHPLKWISNHVKTLIFAVVLVHVGTLIVVALYYMLFELNPTMTHLWHTVVPVDSLRHDIRGVGEGLVGGFLAVAVTWNHYKKRKFKWMDKWMDKVGLATLFNNRRYRFYQRWYAFLWVFPFAAIGFFVAFFFFDGVHHLHAAADHAVAHLHHAVSASPSILDRTKSIETTDWELKVIGLAAAFFFGRRPMWKTFDEDQGWFAESRVSRNRPLHWYHSPTFQARYNDLKNSGGMAAINSDRHGWLRTSVMTLSLVIMAGLTVYGWYILTFIATSSK